MNATCSLTHSSIFSMPSRRCWVVNVGRESRPACGASPSDFVIGGWILWVIGSPVVNAGCGPRTQRTVGSLFNRSGSVREVFTGTNLDKFLGLCRDHPHEPSEALGAFAPLAEGRNQARKSSSS